MTVNEQIDEIVELQPEDTKAVVGGASAIEYGLIAASVSKEIIGAVREIGPAAVATAPRPLTKK